MSFPDKHPNVLYILVSIKLHIVSGMDKGHYICFVLYYYTVTWWNNNDKTITQYPGYPSNGYDDLPLNKKAGEKIV